MPHEPEFDIEFFYCIEEFEAGSSEAYFPSDWKRISDYLSCKRCGAPLEWGWPHDWCPDCYFWCEITCPTLAAQNPEYQRYLRSLNPVPETEPEDLPPYQTELF